MRELWMSISAKVDNEPCVGYVGPDIKDIFKEWLKDDLNSYFLEITINVLEKVDHITGLPIVELISDKVNGKEQVNGLLRQH